MTIWKNGRKPPYMYGTEVLNSKKVIHAVGSMAYTGLQTAAACFLMFANKQGLTPVEIMEVLEGNE